MPPIDLSAVPVIDNHCHGVSRIDIEMDVLRWRSLLTEADGVDTTREHVASTLAYCRLVHHLATYFGCEGDDGAVLRERAKLSFADLTSALLREANIDALVVDTGLPDPEEVFSHQELEQLGGLRVAPLLRVEVLMQSLLCRVDTLGALEDALLAAIIDVRGAGYCGLKTIVAYRTGLDIDFHSREEAEAGFALAKAEAQSVGKVRLAHKSLLDTLLHLVFEEASRQELPVQFHCGYGDTDADMIRANPLYLRTLLESGRYPGMAVVLLHECYPYTREGGYLAALYDRVYLDMSYAIPFLGYGEMENFTRAAFGIAPFSKLLYSSDGIRLPELHWMSALDGRRIIGSVLGEIVATGDLTRSEAEKAGEAVLRGNAARLYAL